LTVKSFWGSGWAGGWADVGLGDWVFVAVLKAIRKIRKPYWYIFMAGGDEEMKRSWRPVGLSEGLVDSRAGF
jgi:hypothetical protein